MAGGSLGQSVFHWKKPQVLTATAAGSIVVWTMTEELAAKQRLASNEIQIIALQEYPITVLTVTDRWLARGGGGGICIQVFTSP